MPWDGLFTANLESRRCVLICMGSGSTGQKIRDDFRSVAQTRVAWREDGTFFLLHRKRTSNKACDIGNTLPWHRRTIRILVDMQLGRW